MRRLIVCSSLLVSLLLSLYLSPPSVVAHGGRTDSYGCHRDTARGDYHCHSGQFAGRNFASQTMMLAESSKAATAARTNAILTAVPDTGILGPYRRELYGPWVDGDNDCQDTATEVLLAEAVRKPLLDSKECKYLTGGAWYDPFTGKMFRDAKELLVEPFIPFAEVHYSGGQFWSAEKRQLFTNDLADSATLIVISSEASRSRADKTPAQWLPPNPDYQCLYAATWLQVKKHWGLSLEDAETNAISKVLNDCEAVGNVNE
jgi:hypothetical protein